MWVKRVPEISLWTVTRTGSGVIKVLCCLSTRWCSGWSRLCMMDNSLFRDLFCTAASKVSTVQPITANPDQFIKSVGIISSNAVLPADCSKVNCTHHNRLTENLHHFLDILKDLWLVNRACSSRLVYSLCVVHFNST